MTSSCQHLDAITDVKTASERACVECVKIGSDWVQLRTCQTCGTTLCCDSSPNRHSRAHATEHDHVVFASAELGERWLYCFADDAYANY